MRHRISFYGSLALVAIVAAVLSGCENHVDLGPIADAKSASAIREALVSSKAAGPEKKAGPVGTGGATIRGQFVYEGDPPKMPPYNVPKEPEFCTDHGKPPAQETLVVDPSTKGIKNIIVFLRDA